MDVQGRKITLVGMGRTALAAARLLVKHGAQVFVTEQEDNERVAAFRKELDVLGIPSESGGHSAYAFDSADIVIPSPGVPPAIPPIQQAVARGCTVISEMELAWHFCSSRVLAVTGTNGKTTTTELLRDLVQACGHTVLLAGNNDAPFSQAVQVDPSPEYIVLEVSSYQLELIQQFRPWLAAVLNVTPDHLARHGSLEQYARIKNRLLMNQRAGDGAVLNADDPHTVAMDIPEGVCRCLFSMERPLEAGVWVDGCQINYGDTTIASTEDIHIPGRHNVSNVLAALGMMMIGKFPVEKVREGIRAFRGVEHRIERVLEWKGVTYYNDSKATNIDSLRVALKSFEYPVILIAGGEGKGADYRVLVPLVREKVRLLLTIGKDAPLLEDAFAPVVPVRRAHTLEEAVRQAAAAAVPGDVVLLSPACASFDQFDNFEHRGRVFKAIVRRMVEQDGRGSES